MCCSKCGASSLGGEMASLCTSCGVAEVAGASFAPFVVIAIVAVTAAVGVALSWARKSFGQNSIQRPRLA